MKVLKKIWSVLVDVFTILDESKKAKALLAGLIVSAFAAFKMDMQQESVIAVLSLLGLYILGQGRADTGKEAVKLELEAQKERRDAIVAVVSERVREDVSDAN